MKKFLRTIFLWIPLALVTLSVLWVVMLKWVPVYVTPLMLKRAVEYRSDEDFKTRHDWVPLEKISPEMIKAVVTSEDNLFFEHKGFDWKAIKAAKEYNEKHIDPQTGKPTKRRGGSTISQQTAKNVFTFQRRTVLRKAVESYFTVLIEWIWGKERIMEVYLNVAEMGKGIYGCQAAAQTYFKKDAIKLGRRESCLIAVCLPSPIKRNPAKPSNYVSNQSERIRKRVPNILYPDWVTERAK